MIKTIMANIFAKIALVKYGDEFIINISTVRKRKFTNIDSSSLKKNYHILYIVLGNNSDTCNYTLTNLINIWLHLMQQLIALHIRHIQD